MSPLGRPPVVLDVVEEHFDELDWLWEHREANLYTTDWTLTNLAEHEEGAEAHLDGLRLAELHGIDLARERIAGDEPFAAAAAALILFDAEEGEFRELIWTALREGGPGAVDGIRVALRHRPIADSLKALHHIIDSADAFRAVAAVDVMAFHRDTPPGLDRLKKDPAGPVRTLALGAAGRTGELMSADLVAALEHEEASVRWAGITAAARSGTSGLLERCRTLSGAAALAKREAIAGLGMFGEQVDVKRLQSLLGDSEVAPQAVEALGFLGYVEAVPGLIELMADDELGIAATLAYRRITGALDVEGDKPFPPPQVGEGEDEEESLPPEPAKAAADWKARAAHMEPQHRWHWGIAFPDDRPPVMTALPLDARRNVYLRLRSRFGSRLGDVELEATAARQVREEAVVAGGGA